MIAIHYRTDALVTYVRGTTIDGFGMQPAILDGDVCVKLTEGSRWVATAQYLDSDTMVQLAHHNVTTTH